MPGRRRVAGAARPGRAARSAARPAGTTISRAWSRRYSRRSVATWSLRLRPACSLPPSAPSRSSRPRSSAVWMSSSAARRPERAVAAAPARARRARRASRSSSSSVEQPGPVQHPGVRARGEQVVAAPAASRTGRSPRAGPAPRRGRLEPAAPEPRRHPARRSAMLALAAVSRRRGGAHGSLGALAGPTRRSRTAAILLGRPHSSTKPLASGLVEGVAGVVGGELVVVQRGRAAPAGDHRPAAVQPQPDLAGDVPLTPRR